MWLPMRVSMKPHGYVGGLYLPMWGHMAVWCGVWPFVLLKTWTSLLKVVLRLVHGCVTTPVSFWWLKISLKLPQIGTHAHVDILSSFGYLCGLQMSSKIAPQHHLCPFFLPKWPSHIVAAPKNTMHTTWVHISDQIHDQSI